MSVSSLADSNPTRNLIDTLKQGEGFGHPVDSIEVIETHISYVILTGPFAYKIKKPVVFPFLDFSTQERRKHSIEEELRLNRRTAPQIYLSIVAITGGVDSPVINGEGAVLEYALKMVQFEQCARLDRVAARGELCLDHMKELAYTIAALHQSAPVADKDTTFGEFDTFRSELAENFDTVRSILGAGALSELADIEVRSERLLTIHEHEFRERKRQGFVRECHGDLHLSNIVLLEGSPTPFDCIEFNEDFRWIDVINEIAFVVMDLDYRGHQDLGWVFANAYLERTGDYHGLSLLPLYLLNRAMIRAKVSALRSTQEGLSSEATHELLARSSGHIRQAERYSRVPRRPTLTITYGLSGSGKSWVSERLASRLRATRIRSDVERKRIAKHNLYSNTVTYETYQRLQTLARTIIAAGFSVIVDAAFLKRELRNEFFHLARALCIKCWILWVDAPVEVLEQRLTDRSGRLDEPSDATISVLHQQLDSTDSLSVQERKTAIRVDTSQAVQIDRLRDQLTSADAFKPVFEQDH